MSAIESLYRDRVHKLSGQQKVAHSVALFEEIRAMLRRRIEMSNTGLDERAIRIKIAEALYRTDRGAQRLLSLLGR